MSINVGANFNYNGKLSNFERDKFTTYNEMINYPATSIDEGHISYCEERKKHYVFKNNAWEVFIPEDVIVERATENEYGIVKLGTSSISPSLGTNLYLLNNESSDVGAFVRVPYYSNKKEGILDNDAGAIMYRIRQAGVVQSVGTINLNAADGRNKFRLYVEDISRENISSIGISTVYVDLNSASTTNAGVMPAQDKYYLNRLKFGYIGSVTVTPSNVTFRTRKFSDSTYDPSSGKTGITEQDISLPIASTTNAGIVSAADYVKFNDKLDYYEVESVDGSITPICVASPLAGVSYEVILHGSIGDITTYTKATRYIDGKYYKNCAGMTLRTGGELKNGIYFITNSDNTYGVCLINDHGIYKLF